MQSDFEAIYKTPCGWIDKIDVAVEETDDDIYIVVYSTIISLLTEESEFGLHTAHILNSPPICMQQGNISINKFVSWLDALQNSVRRMWLL